VKGEEASPEQGRPVQRLGHRLRVGTDQSARAQQDAAEVPHHHHDHVSDLPAVLDAFGGVPVLIHANEADKVEGVTATIEDGAVLGG